MPVSEDVARRIDPMVASATFVTSGGQKSVFRFSSAGREWALKVIELNDTQRRLGEDTATVMARVQREVHILHSVPSPHLPSLGPLTPQQVELDGLPYFCYSEEFVSGTSLIELIVATGRIDPGVAADLGDDVGRAIGALWSQRIVHRDIKPGNIVRRSTNNQFVLLDPGYALDLAEPLLTRTGGIVGTAPYFSPEQLDANNRRALDCRSDLYSLGVVLYEAVTGRHPYYRAGMTIAELFGAIRTQIPANPASAGCPPDLAEVIVRLLRKRPHLRYRSAPDFIADLRR